MHSKLAALAPTSKLFFRLNICCAASGARPAEPAPAWCYSIGRFFAFNRNCLEFSSLLQEIGAATRLDTSAAAPSGGCSIVFSETMEVTFEHALEELTPQPRILEQEQPP